MRSPRFALRFHASACAHPGVLSVALRVPAAAPAASSPRHLGTVGRGRGRRGGAGGGHDVKNLFLHARGRDRAAVG